MSVKKEVGCSWCPAVTQVRAVYFLVKSETAIVKQGVGYVKYDYGIVKLIQVERRVDK